MQINCIIRSIIFSFGQANEEMINEEPAMWFNYMDERLHSNNKWFVVKVNLLLLHVVSSIVRRSMSQWLIEKKF